MLTTSLPPIPQGSNKAHLTLTPAAHALPVAGTDPAPAQRAAKPADYERSCTQENGCDLDGARAEPPKPSKQPSARQKGAYR